MKVWRFLLLLFMSLLLSGCTEQTANDSHDTSSISRPNPVTETGNPFYCGEAPDAAFSCPLWQAQQAKDINAINQLVDEFIRQRGAKAGFPEHQDDFEQVPAEAVSLTPVQLSGAYDLYFQQIERVDWWNDPAGVDSLPPNFRSSNYVRPRFLAYVISGFVAASEAGVGDREQLLSVARQAADYLIKSQQMANRGLFPFPDLAALGISHAHSEGFKTVATRLNKLDEVLVDGWYVSDLEEGGLQLDNGLAGIAMLDLYRATGQTKYLDSALAAADWAAEAAVVPNWNYNSVSVHLLAHAYRATNDTHYLESAKEKAQIGIYPGQLKTGSRKGFWADPHNARLNYHYVLIGSLGALVSVMPEDDRDLPTAQAALASALEAGNQKILDHGIVYPELLLGTLSELAMAFPPDSERLDDFGRAQTLDLLGRFATYQVLEQGRPIQPSAWGSYLRAVALSQNKQLKLSLVHRLSCCIGALGCLKRESEQYLLQTSSATLSNQNFE